MASSLKAYVNMTAIRQVLGSVILQPGLIKEHKIVQTDFVEPLHRLIFAAVNNLKNKGAEIIDAATIDAYLSNYESQYKIFTKDEVGVNFIERVTEMAEPDNIDYYVDQLKKFSLLRSLKKNGIDVSEYFDPNEVDPKENEKKREKLDNDSIQDIANFFKSKFLKATAEFQLSGDRDSKKAGVGGHEQKEKWKKFSSWGIGYSSAFLTTILHGLRGGRFCVKSGGTGFGKTRTSLGDLCYACSPKMYNLKTGEWDINPNGTNNGGLYIGTEMELLEEIDPILWACISGVPQEHIEFNMYEEGEEERVDEAIRILEEEANIWLEYVPEYNSDLLEDIILTHKVQHGIKHVWFDYIHTTAELNAEYAVQNKVKMNVREDMVLSNLSNKIKNMARRYNISIEAGTQVNGDFKNEENRDQTIVSGSKAIINKADGAMIGMPPTKKELNKIEPILRRMVGGLIPNVCYSVYKNRGGKWVKVKVWVYIDYDTMRTTDLFCTDYSYSLIEVPKTYINVVDGERRTTEKFAQINDFQTGFKDEE